MNRFYAILSKRAQAIGPADEAGRKALYAQVRAQLDTLIDGADPPMSTYQRLMQMQALETAIADVEAEMTRITAPAEEDEPRGAMARLMRRKPPPPPAAEPDLRPAQDSDLRTAIPPRQGRKVEDILETDPDAQLSFGVIIVIIGGLFLLLLIGVVIALDPSSFDLLNRNPDIPDPPAAPKQ